MHPALFLTDCQITNNQTLLWSLNLNDVLFLVADTQLYKRFCPSVRWSVGNDLVVKTRISAPAQLSATGGRVSGLVPGDAVNDEMIELEGSNVVVQFEIISDTNSIQEDQSTRSSCIFNPITFFILSILPTFVFEVALKHLT